MLHFKLTSPEMAERSVAAKNRRKQNHQVTTEEEPGRLLLL